MAIGYLYLQRRRLPRWVAWLLLATGTGLIASDLLAPLVERGIRLPIYGAAAALVVLGCVQLDMAGHVGRWRLGLWLGDASYSIYLSHLVTLGALRVVWSRFGLVDLGAHAFAAAALVGGRSRRLRRLCGGRAALARGRPSAAGPAPTADGAGAARRNRRHTRLQSAGPAIRRLTFGHPPPSSRRAGETRAAGGWVGSG